MICWFLDIKVILLLPSPKGVNTKDYMVIVQNRIAYMKAVVSALRTLAKVNTQPLCTFSKIELGLVVYMMIYCHWSLPALSWQNKHSQGFLWHKAWRSCHYWNRQFQNDKPLYSVYLHIIFSRSIIRYLAVFKKGFPLYDNVLLKHLWFFLWPTWLKDLQGDTREGGTVWHLEQSIKNFFYIYKINMNQVYSSHWQYLWRQWTILQWLLIRC